MLEKKQILSKQEIDELHPVIVSIWQEVFTPIIGKAQVTYMLKNYQGKENIQNEIAAGTCYYSLSKDGKMIGYTAYEVTDEYLYLSKIYLAQEYRGKGLMREIFDWYDQLSQELHLKQHLRVNQGNERAISVYKKRGFELIAEDVVDIGQGYQMVDYLFEKNG